MFSITTNNERKHVTIKNEMHTTLVDVTATIHIGDLSSLLYIDGYVMFSFIFVAVAARM